MVKCLSVIVTCAFVIALCCVFTRPAHAYTDPGSSLLLFQSVSSLLTGALFFFRRRLKSVLRRTVKNKANAGS